MSTPTDVVHAMKNLNFCTQTDQFWEMACYLFTEYNGKVVWNMLPLETFRAMAIQLHAVIEAVDTIAELQSRVELIYRTYIVILTQLRGAATLQQTLYNESPQVLKALHHIYRLLFRLNYQLPLFGHVK